MTQLSSVLFHLDGFESSDMQKDVAIREVFNEYVCPPQNANWNPICQEVTGLHPKHPCIMNADPIEVVWQRFVQFINTHIGLKERAILVAWNGASCDLDWIYQLTQMPNSTLSLPPRVKYFIDPYRTIDRVKGCVLNKKKSNLESYILGAVYEKVTGKALSNAHCSLVDAKAQVTIVLCQKFRCIWKTKNSVQYISEMFTR
jgi:hypothetical protein